MVTDLVLIIGAVGMASLLYCLYGFCREKPRNDARLGGDGTGGRKPSAAHD